MKTVLADIYESIDDDFAWNAATGEEHGFKVGIGCSREEAILDLKLQIAGDAWDTVTVVQGEF